MYMYSYPLYLFIEIEKDIRNNLTFYLLGPKDSIIYYNDGEPNDSLQGKCNITIRNYTY